MIALEIVLDVILLAVCAAGAYTDIRKHIIPDWLTYPTIALGVLVRFAFHGSGSVFGYGLVSAVFGAGTCFLLFGLFVVWGKGMGGGDVKLMTAVGALAGFRHSLTCMMCAGIVGAILAVLLVIAKRRVTATAKGIWLQFYSRSADGTRAKVTLPYGLAIFLGAIWATLMKYGLMHGA
ncbi:MAG: prepilin peptidase [Deltaproteobacteria bacterium]|nr:prepilin peptidase [Deltaproteobacteria bacterium]